MLPLSDNPPSWWPQDEKLDAIPGIWKIAHLKPRQEKALAKDLIRAEVPYCCPFYTHVVRRKDNNKPRKSVLPAFSGYMAFADRGHDERTVLRTNRALHVLPVVNQRLLVEQLGWVLAACSQGNPICHLEGPDLETGQRTRITGGPMSGFVGEIVHISGKSHVIVSVEMFRRAIAVQVQPHNLAPIQQ